MGDRYVRLGFESSYGGADVSPFHPTEVVSESLEKRLELTPVKTVRSNSVRKLVRVGESCGGDVEIVSNYNELGPWLRLFFGTYDAAGSNPTTLTFPKSTGTTGRSGISGVVDAVRDGLPFRYAGVKATGIRFEQPNGEPASFSVSLVGKREIPSGELTGTHTGAGPSDATLTDSAASFVSGALIGLVVKNTTNDETGTITANDATTITASLTSGWDNGDAYQIVAPAASGLSFAALEEMQPSHCSLSFDNGSTTVCPISLSVDARWDVDETRCLGSTFVSREPAESDTLIVTGEAQVVFEGSDYRDEYTDFDGETEVDIQVKWDNGLATTLARSLTLNMNKSKLSAVAAPMRGKERLLASFAWQSYFDATATESLQALLVGTDADPTA